MKKSPNDYVSDILSVSELYGLEKEDSRIFFVPEYQREFTWTVDERNLGQIHRLLEDIAARISESVERRDDYVRVTFLGTVIVTKNDPRELSNNFKGNLRPPRDIWHVIDGQQRMTSFLLVLSVLYQRISKDNAQLKDMLISEKPKLEKESKKIVSISDSTRKNILEILMYREDLPRMFRDKDVVARPISQGEYISHVAEFLTQFSVWAEDQKKEKQNYLQFNEDTKLTNTFHEIGEIIDRDFLKKPKERSFDSSEEDNQVQTNPIEFTKHRELFKSSPLIALIDLEKEEDKKILSEISKSSDPVRKRLQRITVSCLIAEYILHNVKVAEVQTGSEDEAIEVFEAMNTTGDPLTSIETFKPRIISDLGDDFKDKKVKDIFERIDNHLRLYSREGQADMIAKIVNTFNYCLDGKRMGDHKSFRHQRRSLRRTYEKIPDDNTENKVEYLNLLTRVSDVYETVNDWKKADGELKKYAGNSPELKIANWSKDASKDAALALRVCNKAFPISMAVPSLLLDSWHRGDIKKQDFTDGMKALLAFWVLYRGQYGGTKNIDQKIRYLLENHLAFWTQEGNIVRTQDVDQLCKNLKGILAENGTLVEKEWVKRASAIDVYEKNKDLAKLLLLAAHHRRKPARQHGKLEKANSGYKSLTLEAWCLPHQYTLEHIAPQTPGLSSDWSPDLYDSNNTIHRLGNLILLPEAINSSLQNASWKTKKEAYKFIINEAKDRKLGKNFSGNKKTFEKLVQTQEADINLRELGGTQVWKFCAAPVAKFNTFDLAKVNTRSAHLSQCAFLTLRDWLERKKEN